MDPTHLEPTRPSKSSRELLNRLRLAMGRPWIDLIGFCGSGFGKDVAAQKRERPESKLSLEKEN